MFLHKSSIWEKRCFWDIGQNPLSQSDCMIFEWTISPKQIEKTTSFLACWCKFTKLKVESWLKIFCLDMVKNGYGQSSLSTLKFFISQEWTNGINWFFACCYKFMQIKSWLKVLRIGKFKSGCVQSCDGTLKLTYLKNEQTE